MGQQLEQLLQRCTVKLSIPGKIGWGTGFFVAPGLILTCHHVVKDAPNSLIKVCWQNQEDFAEAIIERSLSEFDLALLRFSPPVADLPCVYLDESVESRDSLYTYGYPDDFSRGAPVIGECRGLTGDEPPLILFRAAQVRPGLSGSPLLNQRTGKVCGIIKFTLDRSRELGGGAVPTSEILSQFPELEELQQAFHHRDNRWTKLLPRPSSLTRLSRQEYRNRQALLNKVNNFWVKGVLERSLHNQVMIELGLEERPNTLAQPWNMVLQTANENSKPLPEGTKVIDLFDEIGEGRTLLILGEPGSGKTTTLLELTRDLITRAEQNIDHLIPVVFNLSSWAVNNQKIEDWLVEELNSKYQVPKKIGKNLVMEDKLLLLLDGLDEVKAEYREQCITALNHFNQNHCSEIVVCSRIKDYEALSNRLNFQSAVYLRLLTLEQIRHYLNRLGSDVTGLRTLVEEDKALQELAQSPLMLNIMTLAYQGIAIEDLPKTNVVKERRNQLFDDYIERMSSYERIFSYQAPSKNKQRYSKTKTIRWLSWLALRMVQESQTLFLIERMQPNWLQSKAQRITYKLGKGLLMYELTAGLIVGLIVGLIADSISGLMYGLIVYGLIFGLLVWIGVEQIYDLDEVDREKIKTVEILKWSGKKAFRSLNTWLNLPKFLLGFVFHENVLKIICNITLMIFIDSIIYSLFDFRLLTLYHNWEIFIWLIAVLILVTLLGLITALIVSFFSGIINSEIETKVIPNQGIRRSAMNAGIIGLTVGLIVVLIVASISELMYGLIVGLFVGLFFGLFFGGAACIEHFILRLILYFNGYVSWNYARFLDYATERIFLQKVGGGYIFIHRMLMEHFAEMELEK